MGLVLIDALLGILFPLFLGWAVNDLLDGRYDGVLWLGALGVASVVIGSARRFWDTRIYSRIYQQIATEMVARERSKSQSVSTIAARSRLLTELVQFMEHSMPEIVGISVGMVGTLIIVANLDIGIFGACVGLLVLVGTVYLVTGRRHYRLNAHYNEELERQVSALEQPDLRTTGLHFERLMKWNIKLSDLETGNFFVVWLGVIGLLMFTPLRAVDGGAVNYGAVLSLLMYVLSYIEYVVTWPHFIQQLVRLKEISDRMADDHRGDSE